MIHVVQIVHVLQTKPVRLQRFVLAQVNTLGHSEQLVDSLLLQVVAGVDTQVLGLAAPCQRIRTRQHIVGGQFLRCLGRRHEAHLALQRIVRQSFQEVEDTAACVLTNTEGLSAYPDIDDLIAFRQRLKHVRVFLCVNREIRPTRIREMETQLVAQICVAEQHFHLRRTRRLIQVVRALPADDVLSAFGQNNLVTHLVQLICGLVRVQQFGVPNGLCFHAEYRLQQLALFLELLFHLALVVLRCQRIAVRRGEELNGFRSGQLLQNVNHLRVELLEHLNHRSAYAQRAVELAFAQLNHVEQRVAQRQIRGLNKPVDVFFCSHVIVVVMVMADFKETIALQTIRGMHLEAKTYIFHNTHF